jgi:hypothetical protein
MEEAGDRTQAHCNLCAGERMHDVLYSVQRDWHDEEDPDSGYTYEEVEQCILAACCGCGHRTLLIRWWNSGTEPVVTQYPPETVRGKPDWYYQISWVRPRDLDKVPDQTKRELLGEIYSALGAGSTRLALMGIRALLEHIMIEQVGDCGTFAKNLAAFENQGCISSHQRASLSRIIEAGHASMHRAYKPRLEDVMFCLDVTELLIASIYIHPARSQQMAVPQKQKKAKAPPEAPPVS